MGGMLEDDHSATPIQVVAAQQTPVVVAAPVVQLQPGYFEVEVVPAGDDPAQIVALASAIEQMGETLFARDGRYFVATKRYGFMRTALSQLPYVQSVI
jgi:hypothetical protein